MVVVLTGGVVENVSLKPAEIKLRKENRVFKAEIKGPVHTETKTNRGRYPKSLPSTRNRYKKRVRPHETARPAGGAVSTYAGPVSSC